MIFVTVGTGCGGFDSLVRAVDECAPGLNYPVVIQIGNGTYEPKNCEFFKFSPSLTEHFENADLVITAGGVGTVFELLNLYKPFIAVSNDDIPDRHQDELLEKLSNERYLFWCREMDKLPHALEEISKIPLKKYQRPDCTIDQVIWDFIDREILHKK